MALTAQQRRILDAIYRIGRRRGASPMELKAAVETGLVESNLTNPAGGHADSAGWRQERSSLYPDPTNLTASIGRFFDEARQRRGRFGSAGDLAAAVQRPAAQYRERYQGQSARADELLALVGAGTRGLAGAPATPAAPDRRALLQQYVLQRGQPGALATLGAGLAQAQSGAAAPAPGEAQQRGGSDPYARFTARANAIDAQRLPYQWGGGHGAKVNPSRAQPLDCSGAVSAVLGIDPRVSGQFRSWGKPGDGGSRGVTVYSNDRHVFMKVNGHYFGTSASNPGGGAGWIPAAQVSRDYLKGFTVRHL